MISQVRTVRLLANASARMTTPNKVELYFSTINKNNQQLRILYLVNMSFKHKYQLKVHAH